MDRNSFILNVYYNGLLAGHLAKIKEHDQSVKFTFNYNDAYVRSDQTKPLGVNLPKNLDDYSCINKLPPFFDNLVAEGWLRENQIKALKLKSYKLEDKFKILSYFGYDLIGSVSIKQDSQSKTPHFDYKVYHQSDSQNSDSSQESSISINSNSTISGVQKKLLVKKLNNEFLLTTVDELSTHIAKLESEEFEDLIELEYLSTWYVMKVMKILLPNDEIHNVEISYINELNEKALIAERFDRYYSNNIIKRKHFEEFNQILNKHAEDKYDCSYDEMGFLMQNMYHCDKEDILKLFKRILACFLIGNTDAHLKNFSMFHNDDGTLSLTPMYDIVASSYYEKLNTLALKINNKEAVINELTPKQIVDFAFNPKGFRLDKNILIEIVEDLRTNKETAITFLKNEDINIKVQNKLKQMIIKRWNGTFEGIKSYLAKRKRWIIKY